jgi:ribose transport system ATP-binding protein
MKPEPLLRVEKVSKAFPGVQALRDVDFEAYAGEVVALVGENGAGKSTLMKILAGAYQKDSGHVFLEGKEVTLEDPHAAQMQGISIIYQELNLTPNQSATTNIFLGRERKQRGLTGLLGLVDRRYQEEEAARLLKMVGAREPSTTLIRDLSVAQQQMVEIAKALAVESRVIIMDEPTSALGEDEVKVLFQIMGDLKKRGMAVIFITHRLEEVFDVADRVVVLRDGLRVGGMPIAEANVDKIISMMVGRELVEEIVHKEAARIGEVVLEARNLNRGKFVRDVSFTLRRGEILGFAGLVGAGRTETARLLFGVDQKDSGTILVEGKEVNIDSPHASVQAGLGLVPEDRKTQGLVLLLSVRENIALPNLDEFSQIGWVDRARVRDTVQDYVGRLSIRTPHLSQQAMFLSGGNQQKVVLSKWLVSNPRVLIMDEPTRGIDVGAKAEVHTIMSTLAKSGVGIIMISSEMPEVLAMSDRILVMCEGRVTAILDRSEATQEKIMAYASGQMLQEELAERV